MEKNGWMEREKEEISLFAAAAAAVASPHS